MLAALVAGPLVACDARSLVPDAGSGAGGNGAAGVGAGAGGSGGSGAVTFPSVELLSNFEDLAGATVVRLGTPPRNGYWYAYNDASPTCVQTPAAGARCIGEEPPMPAPWNSGSLALHGRWSGCTTWGAGVGADLNAPLVSDGGVYLGPKVGYDIGAFNAITFFAMVAPGGDTRLRLKVLTRTTTRIQDGGTCDESTIGANKCGDHYGEPLNLTSTGTWKQITVTFSNPAFRQEGWGAWFPFVPRDVTGIQIQSAATGEPYDFWIDDMYLLR
jgi:hypothetical protein